MLTRYVEQINPPPQVLKCIAFGFYFTPHSYISSKWNRLDLIVVIIGWVDILLAGQFQYPWMKAIRALRSLRPLRMVRRIPTLQISIDATAAAIPASIRVVAIQSVFIGVFAILGVQFFKGGFSECTDSCLQRVV